MGGGLREPLMTGSAPFSPSPSHSAHSMEACHVPSTAEDAGDRAGCMLYAAITQTRLSVPELLFSHGVPSA